MAKVLETLEELGGEVLGLFVDTAPATGEGSEPWRKLAGSLIDYLVELREKARALKDWATADEIRDRLKELGITLEDTDEGPRWR